MRAISIESRASIAFIVRGIEGKKEVMKLTKILAMNEKNAIKISTSNMFLMMHYKHIH